MLTIVGISLGSLLLIIIVLKIVRAKRQHAAAVNVVFAKYTFSKLSKKKQNLVHETAKDLVFGTDTKLRGFANEVERFGWYALAMDALGIASQVPENPVWNKVKNPYVAIHPGDSMLRAVSGYLHTAYGLDVKISEVKIENKESTPKNKREENSETQ